jgi:hypothetical protein
MTMMIGGKCDGNKVPAKVVTLTEEGETYILVSFKEGNVKHFFYMVTGMTPADAMARYKVRAGLVKAKVEA